MKKRFTEEQIVAILKEAERSGTDQEVIRKHNISDTTFYRWKKLYGGMGVSEVKRLKVFRVSLVGWDAHVHPEHPTKKAFGRYQGRQRLAWPRKSSISAFPASAPPPAI